MSASVPTVLTRPLFAAVAASCALRDVLLCLLVRVCAPIELAAFKHALTHTQTHEMHTPPTLCTSNTRHAPAIRQLVPALAPTLLASCRKRLPFAYPLDPLAAFMKRILCVCVARLSMQRVSMQPVWGGWLRSSSLFAVSGPDLPPVIAYRYRTVAQLSFTRYTGLGWNTNRKFLCAFNA